MVILVIERGPTSGTRVKLEHFPFLIGRTEGNHLAIDDEEVSRSHCRIKRRGDFYILEDLGSRNGTYVNGDKVVNTTLSNGDKILVGITEIQFLVSNPSIHIAEDLLNLDFQEHGSLEPGICEPIPASTNEKVTSSKALRFDPLAYVNHSPVSSQMQKNIDHGIGNLMIMESLHDAGHVLLKSLPTIINQAQNSVLFLWNEMSKQLVPNACWQSKNKKSFQINQNAIRDSLSRKMGLCLMASKKLNIIVMPILYHGCTLGMVHIEVDQTVTPSEKELNAISAFIHKAAPILETLVLRKEMDAWLVGMVETMIAMVEAKDTYTRGHSERVCRYASAIADELRVKKETKRMLMISALCHDIGKIGIPDTILKKASILSAEEYAEMKLHPVLGAEIIKHMPNYKKFISGVKWHHEKWDGTGYPDGLIGEEIPFFGRIVGIADVFDAMISGRAYSGFIDQNEAVEKLQREADLFDPEILKAFIRAYEKGSLQIKNSTVSKDVESIDLSKKAPKGQKNSKG